VTAKYKTQDKTLQRCNILTVTMTVMPTRMFSTEVLMSEANASVFAEWTVFSENSELAMRDRVFIPEECGFRDICRMGLPK
jgi:hypothetical protein